MSRTHGILAEFADEHALLQAVRMVYRRGYRRIDTFSPVPIEGAAEAIGFREITIPLMVFLGGAAGGLTGFFLQYWVSAVDYPLNVGGRPLNSWPSFIPVTFELTILFASLTAIAVFIIINRLPWLNHPLFEVEGFQPAEHSFYLFVSADDPKFDRESTHELIQGLHPAEVYDVPE